MVELKRSSSAIGLGLDLIEIFTMEDENSTTQTIYGGGPGRASTWIVDENQSEIILEEVVYITLALLCLFHSISKIFYLCSAFLS